MSSIEAFTCIIVSILSIGCIIYMIKSDLRSKRRQLYERIEEVEERICKAELKYWKTKAKKKRS